MVSLKSKLLITVVVSIVSILAVTACAPPEGNEGAGNDGNNQASPAADQDPELVRLATPEYSDAVSLHYVLKAIMEDELEHEVELSHTKLEDIFSAMATGDLEAFLTTWTPNTHSVYMEKYGNDVEPKGELYEGARSGLVVPEHVEVDSIEELEDIQDEIGSEIVAVEERTGLMELSSDAIEQYDLDLELVEDSETTVIEELENVLEDEEYIVVTAWDPHDKFSKFEEELKFLEDPEGIFGEDETIEVHARRNMTEDMPEVIQLLSNLMLTEEEYQELLSFFGEYDEGDELQAAKDWIEDNPDKVEEWLPEDE